MKTSSYVVLGALLNPLTEEKKSALLSYLPPEEIEKIAGAKTSFQGMNIELFSFENLLDYVHYSWFLPTLKAHEQEEIPLFLQVLPLDASKRLQKKLELNPETVSLRKVSKDYLKLILLMSLLGEEEQILPPELLPESPLSALISLSKKDLMKLIDFLGLFDLARELKRIVDTKTLKQINASLNEEQKKFINQIIQKKDIGPHAALKLDHWDKTSSHLKTILHKRGLRRLGLALAQVHTDFHWYIIHRLDIGRGHALSKLIDNKISTHLSDAMIGSVLFALEQI